MKDDIELEEKGAGRPSYERNETDEIKLTVLLDTNFPHRQIALYMNKSLNTLKKYYPDLFEAAPKREDKNQMVENGLFYNAVHKLNVVAQLAWLRAHRPEKYSDKAQQAYGDHTASAEDIATEILKHLPD